MSIVFFRLFFRHSFPDFFKCCLHPNHVDLGIYFFRLHSIWRFVLSGNVGQNDDSHKHEDSIRMSLRAETKQKTKTKNKYRYRVLCATCDLLPMTQSNGIKTKQQKCGLVRNVQWNHTKKHWFGSPIISSNCLVNLIFEPARRTNIYIWN